MKKLKLLICLLVLPLSLQAQEKDIFSQKKGAFLEDDYRRVFEKLIDGKYYFSAIPWLKKYIIETKKTFLPRSVDLAIEETIQKVGLREFEVLSMAYLDRLNSPSIKYIRARKNFNQGKYTLALKDLLDIGADHPLTPFALFMRASIYSITGDYAKARNTYKACMSASRSMEKSNSDESIRKKIQMNYDFCEVGIPRSYFAEGRFRDAKQSYQDIAKTSFAWPELIAEEAWTSFYLKDYNRTLGKLVTYNVPFLSFIFNPEIDILKSLAYIELCLWSDAQEVLDSYYSRYEEAERILKNFVREHHNDYDFYIQMAEKAEKTTVSRNEALDSIFKSIIKEPVYKDLKTLTGLAKEELSRIQGLPSTALKKNLLENISKMLPLQKSILGSHIKKRLVKEYVALYKSLEQMGYVKLEILGKAKEELVSNNDLMDKKRGELKYLKRDASQYFWTFNKEFWADELGDYVFALGSKCSTSK